MGVYETFSKRLKKRERAGPTFTNMMMYRSLCVCR